MALSVYTREEWGALSPLEAPELLALPVRDVVLTYVRNWSGDIDDTHIDYTGQVQELQRRQIQKKRLSDIKYKLTVLLLLADSFLVTPQGRVYEGRGWYAAVPPPRNRLQWADAQVVAQLNWRVADGAHRPMVQAIHTLVQFGVTAGYIRKKHQFLETKPWRCPKVIPKLY